MTATSPSIADDSNNGSTNGSNDGSDKGSDNGTDAGGNGGAARRRDFHADLSASIAVFLIALPLSLGIALATGAPLQAGLVAAAVGGIVAGRFGGAPLQVSGPAAGLTVVTAELIQHFGWRTTCAITVLAGCCQLGLAFLRTARSALMVSPAIVHGMLAGIGVTIALAQLHIVLGGTPQSSAVANVRGLPAQLADPHPVALGVSALTLCVLLGWSRVPGRVGQALRKVPAALAAVAGATAFAALAGLHLPRVDLPSWRNHALPELPEGPVLGLIAAVLTITLVGSVESLLSSVATDKLIASERPTDRRPPRADLDRELRGQGAANITSGLLGGLPVTGVAVRSVANVKSGAASRKSTMMHGFWIVLAAGLLVPLLDLIPLAALAALVMAVGIQMVSITHMRTVTRHREILVYVTTIVAVVLGGVLEGVAIGIAVAVAVALHRLARTRITLEELGGVHQVRARGQLTFLAVPRLSRVLNQIPHTGHVVIELDGSFMDHAAYETLHDWQESHRAHGGSVAFTGRSGTATTLSGSGFSDPDAGPDGGAAEGAAGGAGTTGTATSGTGTGTRSATGGHRGEGGRGAHVCCRPWTPWQNHCDHRALNASGLSGSRSEAGETGESGDAEDGEAGGAARRRSPARPSRAAPRRPPGGGAARGDWPAASASSSGTPPRAYATSWPASRGRASVPRSSFSPARTPAW
ncbi:SulP family inorganic anion transporter [Streptomyces sp. RerS4]|nr:SulP family inorganic anion transporter [Streptomyces sp. RerS4]UQX01749.1 SulP family inorganic anion transporter [Streptomyces sp. RerS4]